MGTEATFEDHRLAEYSEEIEDAAISVLWHEIIAILEELDGVGDERAVAEAIKHDGFRCSRGAGRAPKMTFDVWDVDPASF